MSGFASEDNKAYINTCINVYVNRMHEFLRGKIAVGSIDTFNKKVIFPIIGGEIVWDDIDKLRQDCKRESDAMALLDQIPYTRTKQLSDKLLLCNCMVIAYEFHLAACEANTGNGLGWPHLLKAAEQFAWLENTIPFAKNIDDILKINTRMESRRAANAKHGLVTAKEEFKRIIVEKCSDGFVWPSKRQACEALYAVISKFCENNGLPELSEEQFERTGGKWIMEIEGYSKYFKNGGIKIKNRKNSSC